MYFVVIGGKTKYLTRRVNSFLLNGGGMQDLPTELKEKIGKEVLGARNACALSGTNKEFSGLLREDINKVKPEFDELRTEFRKVIRRMPKGQPRNFEQEQAYDAWCAKYDELSVRIDALKAKPLRQAL
jgi:hypothetical protein